jgi:hypothetical protein
MKQRELPRSQELKRITFSLPESLHNALKIEAQMLGVSISYLHHKALRKYFWGRTEELNKLFEEPLKYERSKPWRSREELVAFIKAKRFESG